MPFFSVIIPIFNAEQTLLQSLVSIQNQSFTDFEIILINDGSTDKSEYLAQQWVLENKHISCKLISQKNKGLGAARNTAITKSNSPFCAFLDADDLWLSNKLEVCKHFLQKHKDVEILHHAAQSFGLQKNRIRHSQTINSVHSFINGKGIIPSTLVMATSLFTSFSFSENRTEVEDLPLWLHLLHQHRKIAYIPKILTQYREVGGLSTNIEDHLKKVENALNRALKKGHISTKNHQLFMLQKQFEVARFYHKRGFFKRALHFYKNAPTKAKNKLLQWLCTLHIKV